MTLVACTGKFHSSVACGAVMRQAHSILNIRSLMIPDTEAEHSILRDVPVISSSNLCEVMALQLPLLITP